ncbi:hypothetical protein [Sporomusa sphaeroides]|uniref:hypothetical protein n=1 Tax=Sporomusa sphaeroides TaxID=47679 RepID=UPI002C5B867F|nr:hypothetical protein [Sporomusa sphaeroides]HML33803.1 hypothetical protein [Sporomusa sphaeroides]
MTLKPFGVRLDKVSYLKFRYIAYINGRLTAQEARHVLLRYIMQYEQRHGKITTEQLEQLEERIMNGG